MSYGSSLAAAVIAAFFIGAPASPPRAATSDTCGACHKDIYRMWRVSAHARSVDGPVFLDAYHETEGREGPTVSRVCLTCHAPLVEVNGDVGLRQRATWEGVTCDVCHSLVSVDLTGRSPRPVLDIGRVKRGPIRGASSMGHEVAYSELHTTALACSACHEYTNPEGTPILTTFSEWRASAAAREGRTCQACHMGATRADVVDPKVKRVASEVNLHEVPGGHSLDQLHKALGVAIAPRRDGETLRLDVTLSNKGAGHAVPTGMPGRRVHLELQVRTSQGQSHEARRVYARSFRDARGAKVTSDGGYFARGVSEESDTRIRPDERRTESFAFPVPSSAAAFIELRLHYEHKPAAGDEGRTWLTFYSESRTLPGQESPSR